MTRPRVLHIVSSLAVGGAQRHLLQLLPGLGSPESLDLVYFRDDDLRLAIQSLVGSIRKLPMSGISGPAYVPALAALIRSGRYDLVHTHLLRADMYGAVAARVAGVQRIVSTKHNIEHRINSRGWRLAHRRTAMLARRTICISRAVADWAVLEAGVPSGTERVIPYGIDPAPYERMDRSTARRGLGLPLDTPVLLCPARLDPQKNHAVLLHAFAQVHARIPAAQLWLAGGAQLAPPGYVDGLHTLAGELDMTRSVKWLGVRDDMPRLMAAADLVTLASDWEGLGLVVLEAMAAARPVVATAVGGVPELVRSEETGLLVPPRDPIGLAAAVSRLLDDPAAATRMGEAGRTRLNRDFTLNRMWQSTRAVYDEVLAE